MKPPRHPLGTLALWLILALAGTGCGPSTQETAYLHAERREREAAVEAAPEVIAEYRRVIALEPDTRWAKQAVTRIAALEARHQAEEIRKSVFQEHGVD